MSGPATPVACSRATVLATCLAALAGLATVGRLALEAWLVKPEPTAMAAGGADAAKRSRPVFIGIIDGLRAEAMEDRPDTPMPFLTALGREGVSGIAVTGEPTMTACCVRAILTGRNPDLYTAFRNFTMPPVPGNLIGFLVERGGRAAHAGDAACAQIAAGSYREEDLKAFRDRGAADQGETDDESLPFAMQKIGEGVDVVTFHVVRPDHAGHKFGATGAEYRRACSVVDGMMRETVTRFRALHADATVLVAADHGVTPAGTHGGGEPGARRAPFVLVGPRIARASRVEIPQSALAPTMAAALDLPAPPLAESPPDLALTTLSPAEQAVALDAYLQARIAVARKLGHEDVASAIEAKRAQVWLEKDEAASVRAALADLDDDLEADAFTQTGAVPAFFALLLAGLWLAAVVRHAGRGSPRDVRLALLAGGAALVAAFALPLAAAAVLLAAACAALVPFAPFAPFAPKGRGSRVGGRTIVLAGFAGLTVVSGAGLAVQDAFHAIEDGGPVAWRVTAALLAVSGATAAMLLRERPRARLRGVLARHPGIVPAAGGLLVGLLLSLRLFIDLVMHTPRLVAYVAIGTLVLLVARAWRGARGAACLALACGVALFAGGRVAEHFYGTDWSLRPSAQGWPWVAGAAAVVALLLADALRRRPARGALLPLGAALASAVAAIAHPAPRDPTLYYAALAAGVGALLLALLCEDADARLTIRLVAAIALARALQRSDSETAAFALLALGCRAASAFPAAATRLRLAWLAVALLVLRTAAFHAFGHVESFSTIDVGGGFVPGTKPSATADGGGLSLEVVRATILLFFRFSLVWVAILAAAARAFERSMGPGGPDGLRRLVADLALTFVGRGAVIVAGLWVWWRSSWWVVIAYPTYALGAADVILLVVALAFAGGLRRTRAPAGARPVAHAVAEVPVGV